MNRTDTLEILEHTVEINAETKWPVSYKYLEEAVDIIRHQAKVIDAARKVNAARHSDNARGIRGQFVPDYTDDAIDELEQALAQLDEGV
jgi:hypothetical protein